MEDLPRLLVPPGVVLRSLVRGQEPQRVPDRIRVDREQLVGGDQGVPAEHGHEPGDARGEDPSPVGHRVQGSEVAQAPADQLVEELVVGEDVGALPLPVLVGTAKPVDRGLEVGRGGSNVVHDRFGRDRDQAGLVGSEGQVEVHLHPIPHCLEAVGRGVELDHGAAAHTVGTPIGELPPCGVRSGRVEVSASLPLQPSDLEDVGEVRRQREGHGDRDRMGVVVLHPDPLVQASADRSDPPHVQRLLRNSQLPVPEQLRIGEVDVCHVCPFGRRGQQHGLPPRQPHPKMGEEPGVAVVEAVAVLAAVVDVSGHVRVQEGLAFLDRQDSAREIGEEGGNRLSWRIRQRLGLWTGRSFWIHERVRLDAFGERSRAARGRNLEAGRSLRLAHLVLNERRHTAKRC